MSHCGWRLFLLQTALPPTMWEWESHMGLFKWTHLKMSPHNACWRKWIVWPSSKIVGPSVCGDSIILRASPPTCLSYSQVDLSKNGSATLASSSHCISQIWSTGLLWSFWCLNVFILKIDRFCPTWLSSSTLIWKWLGFFDLLAAHFDMTSSQLISWYQSGSWMKVRN